MKFKIIGFLAILVFGIVAGPIPCEALDQGKVYRIGWLGTITDARKHMFLKELYERGWTEGKNFVMEQRSPKKGLDQMPALADELIKLDADVIVTYGTPASMAVSKKTKTIPIVSLTADPVWIGLVESFARPGGNVTGISIIPGPEMVAMHLEFIKEVAPGVSNIAVLINPDNITHGGKMRHLTIASQSLGVELSPVPTRLPSEIEGAFSRMTGNGAGALIVLGDATFIREGVQIADLAVKNRLPAVYFFKDHIEADGLMSYNANFEEAHRQLARFVDKILRGTNPSDMPVEQPMRYELVINLRAANAIGITIPPTLLLQADTVIK